MTTGKEIRNYFISFCKDTLPLCWRFRCFAVVLSFCYNQWPPLALGFEWSTSQPIGVSLP